jgi:hypothetical protein
MSLKLSVWPARKANSIPYIKKEKNIKLMEPVVPGPKVLILSCSHHQLSTSCYASLRARQMCFHFASQIGWRSQGKHHRNVYIIYTSRNIVYEMKPIQVGGWTVSWHVFPDRSEVLWSSQGLTRRHTSYEFVRLVFWVTGRWTKLNMSAIVSVWRRKVPVACWCK